MNCTQLIGRITKDPEIRYTNNGVANCYFCVAVERPYKDAQGNKVSDFIPCIAFKTSAEFLGKYVQKGNLIAVTGSIQTRSYQTQTGENKALVEVIANTVANLSPRDTTAQAPIPPKPKAQEPQYNATSEQVPNSFDLDEEETLPWL